jgi:leucyl-tRNA synthetase
METSETRSASQAAFYGFEEHLRWYRRRTDTDRPGARWTLRRVLETRLRLLAPFVPFLANELHEQLTGTPAEDAPWPEADEAFESTAVEVEERQVRHLAEDVRDIVEVTDTDPETVRVYVAADWKREVFEAVAEVGPNVGQVMGRVMQKPDLRERGNEVNDLVQELVELVRGTDEDEVAAMGEIDEYETYADAREFFEREFDADVELYVEGDEGVEDPADRAKKAVPFRPAIHIE